MSRLTGLALAAALLAVTGCAKDSPNLTAPNTSAKKEEIFDGPPKAVAGAAQAALEQMKIAAILSTKSDSIRLVGNTRGNTFALIFERRKSTGGEKTAVRIQWDRGVDEKFWMDFVGSMMTALESQQRRGLAANN